MKIDFEFDTQYGVFRDALHLDDNNTLTQAEIDAMKQARLNAWIAVVTAPPAEVTYTLVTSNFYLGSDNVMYSLANGVYTPVQA